MIHHSIAKVFRSFFSEKGSPLDLAIFRIVLFLYVLGVFNSAKAMQYSGLPAEMIFPPWGTGFLLGLFQPSPELTRCIIPFFVICCGSAVVGLFTRVTALGAALSAAYLFGLPELYGKVDHSLHHLIWFMLVLSVSPCSEALSLDALWKARKEGRERWILGPADSTAYARPLRWIWLLMGVIYFFPGLWKALSGWEWVFSENLKHTLHNDWFNRGGWLPIFRIDLHPILCRAAAALVILFELTFLVLLLFPRSRPWAAVGGLAFHFSMGVFIDIHFQALQVCYLSFVPWARLSQRVLGRSFGDHRSSYGRGVVASPALKWMGLSLLTVNSVLGLSHTTSAWPFSCYPTFHEVQRDSRSDRAALFGVVGGKEVPLDLYGALKGRMKAHKVTGFMRRCLAAPGPVRQERLEGLWKLLSQEGVDGSPYSTLRFYREIHWTEPGDGFGRSLGKELIAEIPLGMGSSQEGP